MRAILVLSFALLISSSLCQTWTYCQGSDNSKIDISKLISTPYPIQKGKPANFEFIGTSKINVNQKNMRLDVWTSGQKIFTTTIGNAYTSAAGQPYDYKSSYTIPSFVPPGSYDIQFTMLDTSGNALVCVDVPQNF